MITYLDNDLDIPLINFEGVISFDEKGTHQKLVTVSYYFNSNTIEFLRKRYNQLTHQSMTDSPTTFTMKYGDKFDIAGIESIRSKDGMCYYSNNNFDEDFYSLKIEISYKRLDEQFNLEGAFS